MTMSGPGMPGSLILQPAPAAGSASPPAEQVEPMRDFCPALRNVRLRLAKRLRALEQEIEGVPHAMLRSTHVKRLSAERDAIVAALDRLLVASQRGLDAAQRVRALESLLQEMPTCVTHKARMRVRYIIEGLGSAA
jgi:hypothetical protein